MLGRGPAARLGRTLHLALHLLFAKHLLLPLHVHRALFTLDLHGPLRLLTGRLIACALLCLRLDFALLLQSLSTQALLRVDARLARPLLRRAVGGRLRGVLDGLHDRQAARRRRVAWLARRPDRRRAR